MKQLPFVRSVCSVCHVLFSIFRVMAVIGAVVILFGIFTLSFLPKNTVTVDTFTEMTMRFDLRSFLDDQTWNQVKEDLVGAVVEGAQVTEDGSMIVKESEPSETMENRTMSLALVPVFAQLLASFAFYHFMTRLFKILRQMTFSPFSAEAAKEMKNVGFSLFALTGVPTVSAFLVSLFTGVTFLESGFDMETILWGFVLIALSFVFEFGAKFTPVPFSPQTPGAPGAPFDMTQTSQSFTPPTENNPPSDSSVPGDHHPDAF